MYMTEIKQLPQAILDILARPLPPEALKDHPTKKDSDQKPMTTIKAIFVIDRFNEAFGVGGWKVKTDYITHNTVTRTTQAGKERTEYISAIKTTFIVDAYDIHMECVAGSTNDDLGDSLKGGTTDGLTKIASYLGIGADIWRGTQPKKTAAKPAPTKSAPVSPKPAEPAQAIAPNASFDQPTLPAGFADDLSKATTFEALAELTKKYKVNDNPDENVRAIFKAKLNEQFAKLPKEEQLKAKKGK